MGILNDIQGGISILTGSGSGSASGNSTIVAQTIQELAAKTTGLTAEQQKRVIQWKEKNLSLITQDIKKWKSAWQITTADDPKNYPLQLIYENDVWLDALVTSQVNNRKNKLHGREFSIVNENDKPDEDQTKLLRKSYGIRMLIDEIAESAYRGYSLVEVQIAMDMNGKPKLITTPIPRTNVVPRMGKFYPDYTEDASIPYRELKEFGTYILEFNNGDMGLFNKAVPHVLFKRWAMSCWSELCEIFGIPPRVMKTDTQNQAMLTRAEAMMRDIGAAAWFIIDESEEFEWGKASDTDGAIYEKFKNALNNELSLLFSGAVIGQDTVNGNRSKDESAREVLQELVVADSKRVEMLMNEIVIPALIQIGFLKGNVRFQYDQAEDLSVLWTRTKDSMSEFDIDPEWIKDKFGVMVLGKKETKKLSLDTDFFD